tara:strand:- start:2388 stop:3656 length:1269 start_codon:yes stop_codon:yes gene_type:complete
MANKKITAMAALGATPDTLDVLPLVDVSDVSNTATGETVKVTVGNLILNGTQTLTNKTLTDCDASTQTAGNDTTKIATTAFVTNLTSVGTIGTGVWQGTAIDGAYVDVEGTEVKSTGEAGGTKFLREDGDGTCSWATPSGSGTVTSVATSGTVSGITLTSSPSPIVGSGTVTLGGTLSVEGTEIKSTGETGGTKFLREDGDGTCSWVAGGTVTSITPAADTGSGTAITSSGTLTSTGGDGIDTAVSGTTTTFSLDLNELTDVSGTGDVSGWSAGDTMAIVDSSDSNASKRIKLPAEIGIACSDETTAITTTGDKATLMVPRGMRITEVKASVTVAETSNTVIANVKYHATDPTSTATIFSTSTGCTIATSAYKNNRVLFTDGLGGSQAYYDVAEDGFIVVSVEATAPTDAKGLKIWLLGYWT